jgi:hypothetical protein
VPGIGNVRRATRTKAAGPGALPKAATKDDHETIQTSQHQKHPVGQMTVSDKARTEITKELTEIAFLSVALLERYEYEMATVGFISKEALQMRKDLDERTERIYK